MRTILTAWVVVLLTAAPAPAADPPARPNVVFIMADDLNNDLGCYGSPVVKSPNIDRLAASGVRFDRAYCNYPVCNASRSSLLSGKRPETLQIVDNQTPLRSVLPGVVTLPEHFRAAGYRAVKVGKISHTGKAFEDSKAWDVDIVETAESKKPPAEQLIKGAGKPGVVLNAADADTWDGKVARWSVEHLEQTVKDGKPIFLAVGFRRPHTPYIAPKKYFDLYPVDKMTWQPEPPEHLAGIPKIALTYGVGWPRLADEKRRDTIAAYYAGLSFMDAQVGVLLDALDRLKLWDNTIVVFVSDHGYHLGEHGGLWHKMSLFEQSARVPLVVAAPGKKPAASPRLVELVDLYPTFTELCGLPKRDGLEGTSFAPLLDDPKRPWKAAAFTVVSHDPVPGGVNDSNAKLDPHKLGRSVRTERWRFTSWYDGSKELYDHDADPRELKNLASDPRHAATIAGLAKRLANPPSP